MNEHYQEMKRLYLKLHELDLAGLDQTPEANVVRDAMDAHYRFLSPEQETRIEILSGDLYMLAGTEFKNKSELSENELNEQISERLRQQNWDGVLESLTHELPHISEAMIAGARAFCWNQLGEYDVGILFAQHAAKLEPLENMYRALTLDAQLNLNQPVDPKEFAEVAAKLGYAGPDVSKQKEVIRNISFKLPELHLQTA